MYTFGAWRRAGLIATCALALLAVPALADWDPGNPHKMHFPQLPNPSGWDVCLVDQLLADDFVCSQSGPITDIHFWISWRWDLIGMIEGFEIQIRGPGAVANEPGPVLWAWNGTGDMVVRPYGEGPQGWTCPRWDLVEPNNHFQYFQVNITDIRQPFMQEAGGLYWLAIRVIAWQPMDTVPGWKTSIERFQSPALWFNDMVGGWQPIMPMGELLDLSFVITGPTVVREACCWPDGTCTLEDPLVCEASGGHPMGAGTLCAGVTLPCCLPDGTCVMADPFCCEADLGGHPFEVAILCAGHEEACCLEDGTCVMADPLCCELDYGGTPQGLGSACTGLQGCCLADGTCLDLDPLCCDDLNGTPQGVGTGCLDMMIACCLPDGSCLDTDPLCCDDVGGVPMGWGTTCDSVTCSPYKWAQLPDLSPNGIDISLVPLRILADDFLCTETGLITDVHLWGSWKFDEIGILTNIELSIYSDDPVGLGGTDPQNLYSKPDIMLWQRDFAGSEFAMRHFANVSPGEFWWDPYTGELIENGDSQVFMIDITIPRTEAFLQEGSPDQPIVYWLAVRATPLEGEFGWKTRRWPDHFNDDAVWDAGSELPRFWRELRYPPGHPYHGLELDSIDLAFVLTTQPGEMYPKWSQSPHNGGEGFDAASDFWWNEPPKWEQRPNPDLPGLHAHDWMDLGGMYFRTVLADDFVCQGGDITDLHWWGNYEMGTDGQELRGSGIEHFHLSIHMCAGGLPWCLPMDPELYGFDIPFTAALEQPTGLVNIEGSPIYLYEVDLPFALPQEPGMHYWFDVTAVSNAPFDPPYWRWQEASRDFAPLGLAPAAAKDEPPVPGQWQSIMWPTDQYSDLAFRITSRYGPAPAEPNKVVADDFVSDGRPIESLVWWGSYLDERYSPMQPPVEPYVLDGWFISFHHADPDQPCPPGVSAVDQPTVLGVYYAPVEAVTITGLYMVDCFGHVVFMYEVDLSQCCLLCSETDPRPGAMPPDPARPGRFLETRRFGYWLDIQAVVGVTWKPPACSYGDRILTGHLPPLDTAEPHFWGWHTSPGPDDGQITETACTGRIVDFLPYPAECWDYGDWVKQPWLCDTMPPYPPVHMAFQLLTPVPVTWCLGDMNCSGGSPTFDDIKYFSAAIGSESSWWAYFVAQQGFDPPCPWLVGDYNYPHNGVEFSDIKPFAASIGQPCLPYVP